MSDSSNNGGIGFFGLLFIVFLVLKLTEVIDWSWWWVTAPLWIAVIIWTLVVGTLLLCVILKRRS